MPVVPACRVRFAGGLAAGVLLLGGCATSGGEQLADRPPGRAAPPARTTEPRPQTPQAQEFPAYAVTARVPRLAVHVAPEGALQQTLTHPQESGAPLTFLLEHREGDWLRVYLPVRPNGSTGWVRAAEVLVTGVPYRLDVLRSAHRLELYDRDRLTRTFPIGVGTTDTPTPGGVFYLKELLRPPDPTGPYGPFAYGLSGFSPVLTAFDGGDGVMGLHGTNDESSVGRDVTHGCIRLHNADISWLATLLPLGTPVRILA